MNRPILKNSLKQGFILNCIPGCFFCLLIYFKITSIALSYLFVFALFFCLYVYFKKRGCDLRVLKMSAVLTVALGPFGSFIQTCFMLYYPWRVAHSKSFTEWYDSIFPPEINEEEDLLYERIVTEKEDYSNKLSLAPFREIMSHGSESQKSEAITKILRFFEPRFSGALVMGLDDSDPVIRVRAATAVAYLEDKYILEIAREESILKEAPHEKGALLDLAKILQDYSECAFVDAETCEQVRLRAIHLYLRFLDLDPDEEEVQLSLANLYIKQKKYQEAESIYLALIKKDGISNLRVFKGYLEVLFAEKNFEMIRTVCSQEYDFLDKMTFESLRLKEAVNLWRVV